VSLASSTIRNCSTGINASNGTINFLNTQIINNSGWGVYLDGATPVFGSSLAEWNDIYGNGSGHPGRDLRNGTTDIEAHWVHWGTMDHAQILTQIWDVHDDRTLGYVYILPFINSTHDGQITAVDDPESERSIPAAFSLPQNVPNPFNPATVIRYEIAQPGQTRLRVYDLSGSLVKTIINDFYDVGRYETVWRGDDESGRQVSSGVYFYRLDSNDFVETKRMTLLR
jgi:hypothetical protein